MNELTEFELRVIQMLNDFNISYKRVGYSTSRDCMTRIAVLQDRSPYLAACMAAAGYRLQKSSTYHPIYDEWTIYE